MRIHIKRTVLIFGAFIGASMLYYNDIVGVRALSQQSSQNGATQVSFATYIGGSQEDSVRDITTDKDGNIYVTGGTASADFPTTPNAYDRTFNGWHDAFVAKLDPNGNLIWSTFIGGPNYDRAYAIEVDGSGFVVIGGRAGSGFPVTNNSFQTTFEGGQTTRLYGPQDGFVAKLSPDGSNVVWASYFGTSDGEIIRDIDVNQNGDVYIASARLSGRYPSQVSKAFQRGFQPQPGGKKDGVLAKIASDGSQVVWATYLGGSETEAGESSLRVDDAGNVFYLTLTKSPDIPTSGTAYDDTFNGGWDFYLAKLSCDGRLIYGTYLGGSDNEHVETHELSIDAAGNAYIVSGTLSKDFPVTATAYQPNHGGLGDVNTGARSNYAGDVIVAKVSPDGSKLLASTFIGGRFGEAAEGASVDALGNVYFSGATYSDNFPVTWNSLLMNKALTGDILAVTLSADFTQLLSSTYFGGAAMDYGRSAHVDSHGNFYVAGMTQSTDFPVLNAFQAFPGGHWDGVLIKFSSTSPGTVP